MNENDALLILNSIPALRSNKVFKLLEKFGTAAEILKLGPNCLKELNFFSDNAIESICNFDKLKFLSDEKALMEKNNVKVITCFDHDFPSRLNQIPDKPLLLYVQGKLPDDDNMFLSFVGSRKASFYGLSIAEKFARMLCDYGFVVVSGLARGIDTASHKGALASTGCTVAVLGSGIANIYPKENMDLAGQITMHGAVVSEFSMTMEPMPYNFPKRNRIISGLSQGVIVIEAAEKSGALITADFALEQGRDVFAVPGKVDNPQATGANNLIKQGAKIVTSVEDILKEYEHQIRKIVVDDKRNDKIDELTIEEQNIFDLISDEPVNIDNILEKSSIDSSKINLALMNLELKDLITQLPGNNFIKKF